MTKTPRPTRNAGRRATPSVAPAAYDPPPQIAAAPLPLGYDPDPQIGSFVGYPGGVTGRFLVVMEPDGVQAGAAALGGELGLMMHPADTGAASEAAALSMPENEGIVFADLGIAVVNADQERAPRLQGVVTSAVALRRLEPERFVYPTADLAWLRGYRDAVNHIVGELLGEDADPGGPDPTAAGRDDGAISDEATWGVRATGAAGTAFTGRGIRVAVLDTGVDLTHPDLAARIRASESFVRGESVQDINGHGTHCAGVAAGPLRPDRRARYGVATEAELYVGKVLGGAAGRGTDTGILAGITWAMRQGCGIISMSLGAPVGRGVRWSEAFEQAGARALAAGTAIIAAAGNDSDRRRGIIAPVSHPANCPSIVAVAAVDSRFRVADFSNAGLDRPAGQVDISGPGVGVESAYLMPKAYESLDGTSMATPHVAGVAALWAQADPAARGRNLLNIIGQRAHRLPGRSTDVGCGLVQAP